MTEPLVTKASASEARAQPAEWCDRKNDKHLSYSATWGGSAGRVGSRSVVVGAKIRPWGATSTLPTGLSRRESWRGHGRQRPQLGHSPKPGSEDSQVTSKDIPMAGWRLQLEPGRENAPCPWWPRPNILNDSPSQQYFPSRTVGTELHPSRQAAPRCRTSSPLPARPPTLKKFTPVGKPGFEMALGGQRLRPLPRIFMLIAFFLSLRKLLLWTTYI